MYTKRSILALLSVTVLVSAGYAADNAKYYGGHLCAYKEFDCVKVQRGDSWRKMFPDARIRAMVKRLNRTNMSMRSRPWIVVPKNLADINHHDLSPFPHTMQTDGEKLLLVSLKVHAFGAYDKKGVLIHWGPISGGKGWCSDINAPCTTATGSFRIIHKKGAECVSSRFPVEENGGAPMPYCMYFYRGFALHGSNLPGYHASHGCVRLFKEDAKWLNQHYVDKSTRIVVTQ